MLLVYLYFIIYFFNRFFFVKMTSACIPKIPPAHPPKSHPEFNDGYAERLEKCYSGAVYDVLRAMGMPAQILPRVIRPLHPNRPLAGRIFTVSGRVDFTVDSHTTLLEWTKMLSRAPANSVVVCQPNDDSLAHMGELSAETFVHRGVRGYLCDGGCRDTVKIEQTGFRVWFRYHTPRDVVGRWVPDAFPSRWSSEELASAQVTT